MKAISSGFLLYIFSFRQERWLELNYNNETDVFILNEFIKVDTWDFFFISCPSTFLERRNWNYNYEISICKYIFLQFLSLEFNNFHSFSSSNYNFSVIYQFMLINLMMYIYKLNRYLQTLLMLINLVMDIISKILNIDFKFHE